MRASIERDARNEGGSPECREEKRTILAFRASPASRPQSRAWSFLSLARFSQQLKQKVRLLVTTSQQNKTKLKNTE